MPASLPLCRRNPCVDVTLMRDATMKKRRLTQTGSEFMLDILGSTFVGRVRQPARHHSLLLTSYVLRDVFDSMSLLGTGGGTAAAVTALNEFWDFVLALSISLSTAGRRPTSQARQLDGAEPLRRGPTAEGAYDGT